MKTRLGKRLTALFNVIADDYDSVWDLCCDHGRLGMALLETERTPQVHFVDCIDSIMTDLAARLEHYGARNYQLHCCPAEHVALPASGKHLLVLAGVGDEVTVRIVQQLHAQTTDAHIDWLISPANNLFQVRQFLQPILGVLDEGVIAENGRLYEWLWVRSGAPKTIANPALFWNPDDAEHRRHLGKLLKHARQQQRQAHNPQADAAALAYAQLLESR
ncbi:hypothetical protein BGP77_11220 [Saccharospirillum sp. MSK14-1]|uniref:SAM-dependent methyltransferase n=1 Tax=Saccharospirillum sp. MSK14-1 TaxID=1897632 RepID=UPI000D3964A3|nr:SAM-dependent methyltransferase [Saccharospirillum sp. MSK14-1]PTY38743.1 hypothetical protein BGP77_11220 [Saccharospirillum sp. MSK14-1]